MTLPQRDLLLGHDLTLKQLVTLSRTAKSRTAKGTKALTAVQQTKLQQNISRRMWQRSVDEYGGY